LEGSFGQDFATGAQLSSVDAASRIFAGISAAAGAATFGIEMMDVDFCLPGTPKLFKDGCFTAGTQVVVEFLRTNDATESPATYGVVNLTGAAIALAPARAYLTQNVEMLRQDDWIFSQDQSNPSAPPAARRVRRVLVRRVEALQILTVRSSNGEIHILETTREHPFYLDVEGWLRSAAFRTGDLLIEADGSLSTVIDSRFESHPEGILVYNLEIEEFHTYFVRAKDSTAEPLWVHNYGEDILPEFGESADGTLTESERAEIQAIADKYNTQIDVVGSRAAGEGRNIDTDLPVGEGEGTRSDIDFRIDGGHPAVNDLIEELKAVGNGAGSASLKYIYNFRPTKEPFIRFTPQGRI
jgi:hypothetical protein